MILLLFLLFGGLFIYCAACEAAVIINYIGFWKTFKKMGYEGWECLIPFYNSFVLYKCVWGSGWFFLLSLIPIGGIIAGMITSFQLGKRFGKSTGFCIGLMLVPWLFIFILGLEKAKTVTRNVRFEDGSYGTVDEIQPAAAYQGPAESGKMAMILSSAIVGFLSLIISIITAAAIAIALTGIIGNIGDAIRENFNQEYQYNDIDRDNDWNDNDWNDDDWNNNDWNNDDWSNDDWSKIWDNIDWGNPDAAEEQIGDILDNIL